MKKKLSLAQYERQRKCQLNNIVHECRYKLQQALANVANTFGMGAFYFAPGQTGQLQHFCHQQSKCAPPHRMDDTGI